MIVGEPGAQSGTGLDNDLVARGDQFAQRVGNERDPLLTLGYFG